MRPDEAWTVLSVELCLAGAYIHAAASPLGYTGKRLTNRLPKLSLITQIVMDYLW